MCGRRPQAYAKAEAGIVIMDAEVDTLSRRPARAIGLSPSKAWCTARNAADRRFYLFPVGD